MKFLKVEKITTTEVVNKIVYDIQLEENHFFSANGIITHNCRLKNKIQKEFAFTNGNMGEQTGSKSVITLNISRIVQDWSKKRSKNYDGSLEEYLKDILERVYKYHNAYNEILWDVYNAKLLPAYDAGFINLNKQYLTIGINGLNQAAEFLNIKVEDSEEYKGFCQQIFSTIKEANLAHKTTKTMFNTELVPAESLAVKNYNWDKEGGYWVPKDTNLYASYIFKPNERLSPMQRMKLHGDEYIGEYLDGGSACHINLEEHLSKEQYIQLLKYAAKVGCQYFTFNVPNSECSECGWIGKTKVSECPHCHSKKINYYDRIIGYLTKISNWSEGRREEQKLRVYNND